MKTMTAKCFHLLEDGNYVHYPGGLRKALAYRRAFQVQSNAFDILFLPLWQSTVVLFSVFLCTALFLSLLCASLFTFLFRFTPLFVKWPQIASVQLR